MLTFKQFVSELAQQDLTLSPVEVRDLANRFGSRVLQMGHLQDDGSMLVPIDCILDAARSLGTRHLAEAAEALQSDRVASMLRSAEEFVEHVSEARKRKLQHMVENFQSESDNSEAHHQWKEIEKMIFGLEYKD